MNNARYGPQGRNHVNFHSFLGAAVNGPNNLSFVTGSAGRDSLDRERTA